jgi:hypothetical protein
MTQTISAALDAAGMASFDGEYAQIPEHMQAALRRYVLEGVKPGDFLTAVICNDLRNAVGRADETNLPLLKLYVQWFYNVAPGSCWGSDEKMLKWMDERRAEAVPFWLDPDPPV